MRFRFASRATFDMRPSTFWLPTESWSWISPRVAESKKSAPDNRILFAPADNVELGVNQIIIPGQVEQFAEFAGKHFGSTVDIPVGQIKKSAAFEVIQQRSNSSR
jgi:hypothetical protein